MPSSYTDLIYHIVFDTRDRQPVILPPWREELYRYVGGILMRQRGVLHEIGGAEDHVHLLAGIKAEPSVAAMVRMIKTSSSKWINRRKLAGERFAWQEGYAAFSVSLSQLSRVRHFLQSQERHHQRHTFDEELDLLLKRHDLPSAGEAAGSTRTRLGYHIVFGTKYRQPIIQPPWREELYRAIGDVVERQRGELDEIGGVADHVHLLARFRAEPSVATMLRLIKTNSSKWVNDQQILTERWCNGRTTGLGERRKP